jgi:hypothetical protein
VQTPMKVDFDDKKDNWLRWGQLVEHWIDQRRERPKTKAELLSQMTAHGITGADVDGKPDREVRFEDDQEYGPLVIYLPTAAMLAEARKSIHPDQPYPLPIFYDLAYCGKRKDLNADEGSFLATCRVGEYTINQCC